MTYMSITRFLTVTLRVLVRLFSNILILSLISLSSYLKATEDFAIGTDSSGTPKIAMLDGKSFKGELGPLGKPATATDILVFNDGMFISKGCEKRCGYTAAEYQIRVKGSYFEVVSETPCLKSDATILWKGTVKGNEIEGVFTWKNKRWYWSFEKQFWFKGKLIESTAKDTQQR